MVATKITDIINQGTKKQGRGCVGVEAKFNMTVEQNIFVAKRNIVDYIWKSARLEGISVTFPDTDAIYNLSLIHISEPTRLGMISYAVFCLKKKKTTESSKKITHTIS